MNALHHAARAGWLPVVHALLQLQPAPPRLPTPNNPNTTYPNSMDLWGATAMHHATWTGQHAVVSALMACDAGLIPRTLRICPEWPSLPPGVTPLHLAAHRGSLLMVKHLLRAYVS